MILYHFCCERDMRGIRSQRITKGMIVGERSFMPETRPWRFSIEIMQEIENDEKE